MFIIWYACHTHVPVPVTTFGDDSFLVHIDDDELSMNSYSELPLLPPLPPPFTSSLLMLRSAFFTLALSSPMR